MRKVTFLLLPFFLLSSFSIERTDGTGTPVITELSCYHIKAKTVSHTDYNIWVVTNQGALEEHFIADSCASNIDFEHELLVALKLETDQGTYKINIKRITIAGNAINVYFESRRLKIPVEEGSPLVMASISKDSTVRKVNFYHGDMLVKTVPIVTVY